MPHSPQRPASPFHPPAQTTHPPLLHRVKGFSGQTTTMPHSLTKAFFALPCSCRHDRPSCYTVLRASLGRPQQCPTPSRRPSLHSLTPADPPHPLSRAWLLWEDRNSAPFPHEGLLRTPTLLPMCDTPVLHHGSAGQTTTMHYSLKKPAKTFALPSPAQGHTPFHTMASLGRPQQCPTTSRRPSSHSRTAVETRHSLASPWLLWADHNNSLLAQEGLLRKPMLPPRHHILFLHHAFPGKTTRMRHSPVLPQKRQWSIFRCICFRLWVKTYPTNILLLR
jgi:hypothetical protein